jgi:hypothetical protein
MRQLSDIVNKFYSPEKSSHHTLCGGFTLPIENNRNIPPAYQGRKLASEYT